MLLTGASDRARAASDGLDDLRFSTAPVGIAVAEPSQRQLSWRTLWPTLRRSLMLTAAVLYLMTAPAMAQSTWGVAVHVTVPPTKANGEAWDILKGAPDLVVCTKQGLTQAELDQGLTSNWNCGRTYEDSYTAYVGASMSAGRVLFVQIADKDVTKPDYVGDYKCPPPTGSTGNLRFGECTLTQGRSGVTIVLEEFKSDI